MYIEIYHDLKIIFLIPRRIPYLCIQVFQKRGFSNCFKMNLSLNFNICMYILIFVYYMYKCSISNRLQKSGAIFAAHTQFHIENMRRKEITPNGDTPPTPPVSSSSGDYCKKKKMQNYLECTQHMFCATARIYRNNTVVAYTQWFRGV